MARILILLIASLLAFSVPVAEARKKADTYTDQKGIKRHTKTQKIYRSHAATREFKKKNPKPKDGRKYHIDHKKPLKYGGEDKPSNMQWLEVEEHKRKSATE